MYCSIFINGIVFSCHLSKNDTSYYDSCKNSRLFNMKPLIEKLYIFCEINTGNYQIKHKILFNHACSFCHLQNRLHLVRYHSLAKVSDRNSFRFILIRGAVHSRITDFFDSGRFRITSSGANSKTFETYLSDSGKLK